MATPTNPLETAAKQSQPVMDALRGNYVNYINGHELPNGLIRVILTMEEQFKAGKFLPDSQVYVPGTYVKPPSDDELVQILNMKSFNEMHELLLKFPFSEKLEFYLKVDLEMCNTLRVHLRRLLKSWGGSQRKNFQKWKKWNFQMLQRPQKRELIWHRIDTFLQSSFLRFFSCDISRLTLFYTLFISICFLSISLSLSYPLYLY